MDSFFQIVGSIASLLSIPLAFYFYFKSKENKFDQLKRKIIKILSYQIGDERRLSTFEIQNVIKSKLRENRIEEDSIAVSDIVEDLVTEVISSPLIEKERKSSILENLKRIYIEDELITGVEDLSLETAEIDNSKAKEKIEALVEKRKELNKEFKHLKKKTDRDYEKRLSTLFAVITGIMVSIISLLTIGDSNIFAQQPVQLLGIEISYNPLLIGMVVSLLAILFSFLIRRVQHIRSTEKN